MNYTRDDFENVVRNFDISNKGSTDFRVFATCCVLLRSPLPAAEDLDAITNAFPQGEADKESFQGAALWLDATESSQDREYSHPFERAGHVKGILFDLYADDGATMLPVPAATDFFAVRSIRAGKTALKTYGDILNYQRPGAQK